MKFAFILVTVVACIVYTSGDVHSAKKRLKRDYGGISPPWRNPPLVLTSTCPGCTYEQCQEYGKSKLKAEPCGSFTVLNGTSDGCSVEWHGCSRESKCATPKGYDFRYKLVYQDPKDPFPECCSICIIDSFSAQIE